MKNNKGFTLIELLAVILILGIIALIAIPTVTSVVESAKKSSLETTTLSTIKSAEDYCVIEKLKGEIVTNKHFIKDYKSDTLEMKNLPKEGTITVDDECSAYAAVTDGTFFATGTTQLVEVSNDETKYEETNSLVYTKDSCFIFDKNTKTITGYNYQREECGTDIGIPSAINNIPVEHIGDEAFYIPEPNSTKIYYAMRDDMSIVEDYNLDIIDRYKGDPGILYSYYAILTDQKKRCWNADNTFDEVALDYVPGPDATYITCIIYASPTMKSKANLTSVDFRAAVNLKTIGENAFFNNEITSIKFGSSNKNITSIGKNAFAINKIGGELDMSYLTLSKIEPTTFEDNMITSIKFPNELEVIDSFAFSRNNGITELEIPEGVTSIRYYGFAFNDGLISVTLPSTTVSLSSHSFYGNDALTSVTLPKGVQIGDYSFCETSLSEINVPDNATVGMFAIAGSPVSKITIGNNVVLKEYALSNSYATVDTLSLPGSITSLANYAFYKTPINNLILNNGTTIIGNYSFRESKIKNITWNTTLTKLGTGSFQTSNLKTIVLPNSLKTINGNAFYGNTASTPILEIPSTVTSIGSNAFYNNYFGSIKINTPKTTMTINASSFKCTSSTKCAYTIDVDAQEGVIANAPWGNTYATINYLK